MFVVDWSPTSTAGVVTQYGPVGPNSLAPNLNPTADRIVYFKFVCQGQLTRSLHYPTCACAAQLQVISKDKFSSHEVLQAPFDLKDMESVRSKFLGVKKEGAKWYTLLL